MSQQFSTCTELYKYAQYCTVYYIVLQYITMYYNVLQCITMYYNVLHVLQIIAIYQKINCCQSTPIPLPSMWCHRECSAAVHRRSPRRHARQMPKAGATGAWLQQIATGEKTARDPGLKSSNTNLTPTEQKATPPLDMPDQRAGPRPCHTLPSYAPQKGSIRLMMRQ